MARGVFAVIGLPSVAVCLGLASPAHALDKCPSNPQDPHCAVINGKAMFCKDPNGARDFKNCPNNYLAPTEQRTGTVLPAYYVITILYVAPGNSSEEDYGQGSSSGSEVDESNTAKLGLQVGTTGTIQTTVGFSVQQTNGTTFVVSKSTGTTLQLHSTSDPLDHSKDTFVLWTNPQIDGRQVSNNDVETSLAPAAGQPMRVVQINVGEARALAGRNSASVLQTLPADKRAALASLKPDDYAALLKLDPFASGGGTPPDAHRFTHVESLQLDGPDQPGDPVPGTQITVSNETDRSQSASTQTALTVSVVGQTGFSFFGLLSAGVQVGGNFEWDYTRSQSYTVGQNESATLTLSTSTVGYNQVVDVYYDTLFKTFAMVCDNPPLGPSNASIAGVVTSQGKSLAGQVVTVKMPDGTRRRVATNAKGLYRVFGLPDGTNRVILGSMTKDVVVKHGQIAQVGLDLSGVPTAGPTHLP